MKESDTLSKKDDGDMALMQMCDAVQEGLVKSRHGEPSLDDYLHSALPTLRKHFQQPFDNNPLLNAKSKIDGKLLQEVMGYEFGEPFIGLIECKNPLVTKFVSLIQEHHNDVEMDWEGIGHSIRIMCEVVIEGEGDVEDDKLSSPLSHLEKEVFSLLKSDYEKMEGDTELFGSQDHLTVLLGKQENQWLWLMYMLESYMVSNYHTRIGFMNLLFSTYPCWQKWSGFVKNLQDTDPVMFTVLHQFIEYSENRRHAFHFSVQSYLLGAHWALEMSSDSAISVFDADNSMLVELMESMASPVH